MFPSAEEVVQRVAADARLRRFMAISKEHLATILEVHADVQSAITYGLVIDTPSIPDSVLRELEAASMEMQPHTMRVVKLTEPLIKNGRPRGFYWRGPGEPEPALRGPFKDIQLLTADAAKHSVTNPVVVENP